MKPVVKAWGWGGEKILKGCKGGELIRRSIKQKATTTNGGEEKNIWKNRG